MSDIPADAPALDRRAFFAMTAAASVVPAFAGAAETDPNEEWPLWPGRPPGAPAILPDQRIIERSPSGPLRDRIAVHVSRPIVTVFRPQRPNGGAVLIVPGGGFVRVAVDKEGYETGRWLSQRGLTAFVLRYRMPGDGWSDRAHVPLQDASRAMRLIRTRGVAMGIDPKRVAMLGFSAGGHVAAMLSVLPEQNLYPAVDEADRLPARPDLTGLVYAAVSMASMARPGSPNELLGPAPSAELIDALSAERNVRPDTPPTILFHAADDATVPMDTSLTMFRALRAAQVRSELHVFEEGGHGFGLRLPPTLTASRWPELFRLFGSRHGLLS